MRRHLPVEGVQATDADHGAARSVGIETLEAGADTTWPSLLKTCRSVAKAFSACALVPLNEMKRWLAGIAPIEKPWDFSQLVTLATSASVGAKRDRHAAAVRYRPYSALEGSETADAKASAPAASRSPRAADSCSC